MSIARAFIVTCEHCSATRTVVARNGADARSRLARFHGWTSRRRPVRPDDGDVVSAHTGRPQTTLVEDACGRCSR